MDAGSGRATSGTHPVDEVLEVGEIPATYLDHHVDITDDVPGRDHIDLTAEDPLKLVEAKPGEADENERLHAG